MEKISTALEQHKRGQRVYLTSPLDDLLDKDEKMSRQGDARQIYEAVVEYEISIGNLRRDSKGMLQAVDPTVFQRLPIVRSNRTKWEGIPADKRAEWEARFGKSA